MRLRTLLIIVLFPLSLLSQNGGRESSIPLKLGDTVPDYELINLINYPSAKARFSDFKGKIIILDFWSTYCASCIEAWPKLLALQEQFKGKIQIILINAVEKETIVRQAFEKRKRLAGVDVTLPAVCFDSSITKLFPYSGLPHVVWIGSDMTVKSITQGYAVNGKNIKTLLDSGKLGTRQKSNNTLDWDVEKPLFINENGGNGEQLKWQSVLAGFVEGLRSAQGIIGDLKADRLYKIVATNTSVRDMYSLAYTKLTDIYGNPQLLSKSRIALVARDTSKYVERIDGEYVTQNYYTYELTSPPTTRHQLQHNMQEDLKRYFGLRAYFEKRVMKCLVFAAFDTTLLMKEKVMDAQGITTSSFKINGMYNMKQIVSVLEKGAYYWSPYPIIDETGFHGYLKGIDLDVNVADHKALNSALKKYGLSFSVKDREIDILVLAE